MKYILSVDIGTTSAKALVISQGGDVLASTRAFYPTHHPQPDFSEQDPEEIFESVEKIIRHAAEKVKGQVDAVCFSSAMHSLMAVDDQGEALTPLIIWADLRSKEEAHEIAGTTGQKIYEETGTPIHSMSPLCKLVWLKKHQKELFKKTTRFIGIKEYIWFKLFRAFAVDHSVASATGLLNTTTKAWSTLALAAAGVSPGQLAVPVSGYKSFSLDDQRSKDLGLSPHVKWIIGASDGCLANLGSGAMDDKTLSLTIGTSGAVRKVVKKNYPDAHGRTFHYLLDEETLITGGATNNGAILVQWFSEKFLKEKVDVAKFGEQAAGIPAGAEGLIFLPYLLGERAPIFDPESAGVFFGIRQKHTTEHFMRALLEGIGYALFSIAQIVEKNSGVIQKVVASGGFIKSPHWIQIVADICGKEVIVRGTDDASALGAALMGFKALGVDTSFKFPTEKTYSPDRKTNEIYGRYFAVYTKLYPHLADDFHQLGILAKG